MPSPLPPGRRSPFARPSLTATLPWFAVLLLGLWLTSPLWRADDQVFIMNLHTESLRSPWWYDQVARILGSGHWIEATTDLDWPAPRPTSETFASVADAVLAAPLAWLLPWPAQWNLVLVLATLINGLGVALLARATGCRGMGIVVAGALAMVIEPVLKEMALTRPNAIYPGIAAAALAAWLLTWPGEGRSRRGRWVAAGAAAALGALAGAVYPPYLLMLVPAALVWSFPHLRARGWRAAAVPGAALAGGLVLAAPALLAMFGAWATRFEAESKYLGCPGPDEIVSLVDLVAVAPQHFGGRVDAVVAVSLWPAAALALLRPARRASTALLLAVVGACAVLALGPCPVVRDGPDGTTYLFGHAAALGSLRRLWPALTDLSRFLVAASVVAAVLAGQGSEALTRGEIAVAGRAPLAGRRWLGWGLGIVVSGLVVAHGFAVVAAVLYDPYLWHRVAPSPTARFLRDAEPGPVAELPWSYRVLASVMEAPGSPRVNPIDFISFDPVGDPFVDWLSHLGIGEDPGYRPTPEQVRASGVRWVIHDPAICDPPEIVPPRACGAEVRGQLRAVLGEPGVLEGDIWVWDLGKGP